MMMKDRVRDIFKSVLLSKTQTFEVGHLAECFFSRTISMRST